jgi:hypothetical protein
MLPRLKRSAATIARVDFAGMDSRLVPLLLAVTIPINAS